MTPVKNTSRKAAAARFGLFVALGASVVAFAGTELVRWTMSGENQVFIQQSVGDTAGLVAGHVASELEHLKSSITAIGELELRTAYLKYKRDSEQVGPLAMLPGVGSIEADPDILAVSLWSRSEGQALPYRGYLSLNARFEARVPDLMTKIQLTENDERQLLDPAFQGLVVVLRHEGIDPQGMAFVVVPLGHGLVSEVAAAHVRLDRFQRILGQENRIRPLLVDARGALLASASGVRPADTKLIELSSQPSMVGQPSSQLRYADPEGGEQIGAFHRVSVGQVNVLATVPGSGSGSGTTLVRTRAAAFVLAVFGAAFLLGLLIHRSRVITEAAPAPDAGTGEAPAAERRPVTVIRGELLGLSELVGALQPAELAEAIVDYLTLAGDRARAHGGLFQAHSGSSFTAVWGEGGSQPSQEGVVSRSIRCALELRRAFAALNESRKLDGQRELRFSMGIHSDSALVARLGAGGELQAAAAGEVHACASALANLAAMSGVDVLISQAAWQQTDRTLSGEPQDQAGSLLGECLGEAKLTPDTGLTSYHWVAGYVDGQGHKIFVESPYARRAQPPHPPSVPVPDGIKERPEPAPVSAPPVVAPVRAARRWLINNGSQIVGPLSGEQIAAQLFAQEFDFDAECWAEGTGDSSRICDAGIFTGSEDEGASFWVYDGRTIHGPLSRGFLATALSRGAVPADSHVCEGGITDGWKPVEEWTRANPIAPPSRSISAPESMARLESDLLAAARAQLEPPPMAPPMEHAPDSVREKLAELATVALVPASSSDPEPTFAGTSPPAHNPERDKKVA